MQELAVFIDLNTYRITDAMLGDIKKFSTGFDNATFNYYNYSQLLHKNLKLVGKTFSTLSGRRKVQIDIRIICDALEYACAHKGGNVLLLCGIIDARPLFDKLKNLKATTTFATMQKVNIGATNYLMLSRETSNQDIVLKSRPPTPSIVVKSKATHVDTSRAKTLVTTENVQVAKIEHADDYDTQLQELNILLNKLNF